LGSKTIEPRGLGGLLDGAGGGIQLSEHLDGSHGPMIFDHACRLGLEGIVSKRRDRPYRSGRCSDWIKVKNPNAPTATRLVEWPCRGRGSCPYPVPGAPVWQSVLNPWRQSRFRS
jgi:hypothetical protein